MKFIIFFISIFSTVLNGQSHQGDGGWNRATLDSVALRSNLEVMREGSALVPVVNMTPESFAKISVPMNNKNVRIQIKDNVVVLDSVFRQGTKFYLENTENEAKAVLNVAYPPKAPTKTSVFESDEEVYIKIN